MTITIGTGVLVGNGITIDGPPTAPSLPTSGNNTWYAVAYGNGKFVTTGSSINSSTGAPQPTTQAAYSTQGTGAWTATTIPSGDYQSITYGADKFVAVGDGTAAAYSTDGITWTASTLPTSQGWLSVAYGNGVYVAVGRSSSGLGTNKYATSTDGITWTDRTFGSSPAFGAVTFGNGQFVLMTTNGSPYVSANGTSWTAGTNSGLTEVFAVAYGNGKYVAVSQTPGSTYEVAYSTDGLTWTRRTGSGLDVYWNAITYGNGLFVAVGFDAADPSGPLVMYSSDAITWSTSTLPRDGTYVDIAFGPGMYEGFVVVGYTGVGATPPYIVTPRVDVSRDGITWY